MNTIRRRTLVLAALAFLSPAVRSEQPQKATRSAQEDHIKKLEERVDAAEKVASGAAMERDYTARTQKLDQSYYEKLLHTEIWFRCQIQLKHDRGTRKNGYGRSHYSNA